MKSSHWFGLPTCGTLLCCYLFVLSCLLPGVWHALLGIMPFELLWVLPGCAALVFCWLFIVRCLEGIAMCHVWAATYASQRWHITICRPTLVRCLTGIDGMRLSSTLELWWVLPPCNTLLSGWRIVFRFLAGIIRSHFLAVVASQSKHNTMFWLFSVRCLTGIAWCHFGAVEGASNSWHTSILLTVCC